MVSVHMSSPKDPAFIENAWVCLGSPSRFCNSAIKAAERDHDMVPWFEVQTDRPMPPVWSKATHELSRTPNLLLYCFLGGDSIVRSGGQTRGSLYSEYTPMFGYVRCFLVAIL